MTSSHAEKRMNALEREILLAETGGIEPRLVLRSNTRIDTGLWWWRTPLWFCITDDDVIVLAASRRRYVERVSIGQCGRSYYCHTTGELVVDAGEALRFNRLRMSPADALRALHLLGASGSHSNESDLNHTECSRA